MNGIHVTKFHPDHPKSREVGLFIHLHRETALKIIQSLLEQINANNPNKNRLEFSNFDDTKSFRNLSYLSIAVDPEKERIKRKYPKALPENFNKVGQK